MCSVDRGLGSSNCRGDRYLAGWRTAPSCACTFRTDWTICFCTNSSRWFANFCTQVRELVQFACSPEHIALFEVMPLAHSAADYKCVDPFWTYGLNRDDTFILKTLMACRPVEEQDVPVSTHSSLWPPALDFQVHLTHAPMCFGTLTWEASLVREGFWLLSLFLNLSAVQSFWCK